MLEEVRDMMTDDALGMPKVVWKLDGFVFNHNFVADMERVVCHG